MQLKEKYNFIDYVKVIDLAFLALIDMLQLGQDKELVLDNDKLVVRLTPSSKRLPESLVVDKINDMAYYGAVNIVVDTCIPRDNWRKIEQIVNTEDSFKYEIADDSISVDVLKMNQFFNALFSKLEKKMLKLKFIKFKMLDQKDAVHMMSNELSRIGSIIQSEERHFSNLIQDGNHVYLHQGGIRRELFEDSRLQLVNKGIL